METLIRKGPLVVIGDWWNRIPKQVRTAFITAVIVGAITHFYAFVHLMPNHDFVEAALVYEKDMLFQGRWFQRIVMLLTSGFNMPWVNGIISVFILAVASGFIVSTAGIKKSSSASLAAGLLVTFPTIAGWFNYLYMTDGFMWGLFLAVLAVYVSRRMEKYGFLIAAALICLSIGIYQAFVCCSIALSVICLIMDVLRDKKACKALIIRGIKDLASIVLGVAIYAVVLFILLQNTNVTLTDYQGINEIGIVSIAKIFPNALVAFKSFFKFFIFEINNMFPLPVTFMYWAAFILSAFFGISVFFRKRLYRQRLKTFLLLLLLLLAPISLSSAYLLSAESVHRLMIYSLAFFFVLWICLGEEYMDCAERDLKGIVSWSTLIVSAVIIFGSYILCNQGYLILQSRYNQTYAYANRIVSRIEDSPHYFEGIPIAFFNRSNSAPRMPRVAISGLNYTGTYQLRGPAGYYHFFREYIGVEFNVVPNRVLVEIKQTDEYKKMKKYPHKDCIKLINDVLVVKLEYDGKK